MVVSYNLTLSYQLFSCQSALQQSYRLNSRTILLFPFTEVAIFIEYDCHPESVVPPFTRRCVNRTAFVAGSTTLTSAFVVTSEMSDAAL